MKSLARSKVYSQVLEHLFESALILKDTVLLPSVDFPKNINRITPCNSLPSFINFIFPKSGYVKLGPFPCFFVGISQSCFSFKLCPSDTYTNKPLGNHWVQ